MKIAISTDTNSVSPHFGRCPQFTIVELTDGAVTKKETIDNPGHHPGYLPEFLGKMGVECIVAGGMGAKARDLFEKAGIEYILGIEGSIDDIVGKLSKNELKGKDSLCSPHSGKEYGVPRTEAEIDGNKYEITHEHHNDEEREGS